MVAQLEPWRKNKEKMVFNEKHLVKLNFMVKPRKCQRRALVTEEILFERAQNENGEIVTGEIEIISFEHAINPSCRPTQLKALIINGSCSDRDNEDEIVAEITAEVTSAERGTVFSNRQAASAEGQPYLDGTYSPRRNFFSFHLGEVRREHSVIITFSHLTNLDEDTNGNNHNVELPVSLDFEYKNTDGSDLRGSFPNDNDAENRTTVRIITQRFTDGSRSFSEFPVTPVNNYVKLRLGYEEPTPPRPLWQQNFDYCMFKFSGLSNISETLPEEETNPFARRKSPKTVEVGHPFNDKYGIVLYHPYGNPEPAWFGVGGLLEVTRLDGHGNNVFVELFNGEEISGFYGFVFDERPANFRLNGQTFHLEMDLMKNPLCWSFIQSKIDQLEAYLPTLEGNRLATQNFQDDLTLLSCTFNVVCKMTAFIGVAEARRLRRGDDNDDYDEVDGHVGSSDESADSSDRRIHQILMRLAHHLSNETEDPAGNFEQIKHPRQTAPSGARPSKPTETNKSPKITALQKFVKAGQINGLIPFKEELKKQISIICSVDLFSIENKPGLMQIIAENVSCDSLLVIKSNDDFLMTITFVICTHLLEHLRSDKCIDDCVNYAQKSRKYLMRYAAVTDGQLTNLTIAFKEKYLI